MIQIRMFKITPPIRQKCRISTLLLFTCTLLSACTCCSKKADTGDAPRPVQVRKSLFHNPDSLAYYAALAYKDEDPQGLYVTGAAAFLRAQDPSFPDSCTTVSLDEASIMLLRAAELGHPDALTLIHCLDAAGCWGYSVPEDK